LHLLGVIQVQRGQFLEAARLINKALKIRPNDPQALYHLGSVYLQMGLMERPKDAPAGFERGSAVQPGQPDAHSNHGNVSENPSRLDEALESFDKVLTIQPDNPEAHNNRGIVLGGMNRLDEALESFDKALVIHSGYGDAHNNRGNVLRKLGRLEESLESFDKVLTMRPDNPEAHNNRGMVLGEMNRLEEALESFDKALVIHSDYADAHNNRGNVLRKLNRLEESLESFDKVLTMRPDNPEAHNNRGIVLGEMNRLEEALKSFDKALVIHSDYGDVYNKRGNVLRKLSRLDEALESFNRALTLQPDDVNTKVNLAAALAHSGDYSAAVAHCEEAIALNPDYALGHRFLSRLKKFMPGDPHITQMEALLNAAGLNDTDAIQLNFALAKAYEDIKEVDRAFACLQRGNRLCKAESGYQTDHDRQMFSVIQSLFRDGPLEEIKSAQSNKRPIFVLGMPRSGTTLVEQILASHSQVFGAGELIHLQDLASPVVGEATKNPRFLLDGDRIESIRIGYLARLEALNVPEWLVTDKMPSNFRYIGFIFAAFPEARVININRNAVAVGWSIYKHHFSASSVHYKYDLTDIAEYFALYSNLMKFWRGLFPDRILDVDYEGLTEDQEKQTRRLLAYCGLDWEDACLDFHNTERVVQTLSHAQVREPMYTGSSDAWLAFKAHLGPLIDALAT
jgi:tetratricopeptide (TPR) repeat protein